MASFSIPPAFIDAPLKGVERHGFARDIILSEAGIEAGSFNPDGSLAPESYARLMLTIWRKTNDEAMGLNPEPVVFRTFAMMGRSIITCATLEHAIRRASSFYRLQPHSPQITVEKGEHRARLLITHESDYDPDHFLSESLLVIWHRFCSWLIGRGIPLLKVECPYAPPGHVSLYDDLFATPVTFNCDSLSLTIPLQAIHAPVVQSATSLEEFLGHSPADILARPNPHESTSAKVRHALMSLASDQMPDLTGMADALSVSGATLRRRLRQEGTTYQTIKDNVRLMEAKRLLACSELSIADIAVASGFSETSAFTRAFSRWTGDSPANFRRRNSSR
ncbi:MAG: AraC family transcriptional regulator [Pseudomonadota bacterium]|nr:AraC family transcriptional regulator [Pseudomonadota bacterium]